MKMKVLAILIISAVIVSSCGVEKPAEKAASETDRRFYYQNTKWGMTIDEVTKARGEPDEKDDGSTDVELDDGSYVSVPFIQQEDEQPEGLWDDVPDEEGNEPLLIDYYYFDKTLFDKYDATEKFLFDAEQKLEGVTVTLNLGTVEEDLSNLREVTQSTKEAYLDIKDTLTELFGPSAAEYTAYQEGGSYRTAEELDLDSESTLICTTRWDGEMIGDNYRFIYVMYRADQLRLDVMYTYHSKERVDEVNSKKTL